MDGGRASSAPSSTWNNWPATSSGTRAASASWAIFRRPRLPSGMSARHGVERASHTGLNEGAGMSRRRPGRSKRQHEPLGLACPKCGGPLLLCFTRPRAGYIYRRRKCSKCGEGVSTTERISGLELPQKYADGPIVESAVHLLLQSLGKELPKLDLPFTIAPSE